MCIRDRITWKVEVNPRGLDLSGIVITDDIKAYGQTYVKDSLDAQLTDPSVDSKVEIDDDTGILTVRFENIGTKTITYTFKTTVDDPGDYAYNLTKKDYKNTVNAEAVLNNGTPGSKLTASAAGTQAITSNVLQKKAEGYDYSDNTIGWCITVNKNKMPMKSAADVLVTDILENGLSYVDGSMRVTKEDNNGNIVEFTGITDKKILDEIVERSLKGAAIWDECKDKLDQNAYSLSGGQQQRICIARCLAIEPDVILMDEPTSALDPISTLKVEELVQDLKSKYSIIIVTHNMQQAARISDKTAFFLNGYVNEFDNTDKIFSNPADKQTEDYISGRFG